MKINGESKIAFYEHAYKECETVQMFYVMDYFYTFLVEWDLATQEELELAGSLCGYTEDTVKEVFYYKSGGYSWPYDFLQDYLEPEEFRELFGDPEEEPEEDSEESEEDSQETESKE